MAGVRPLGRWNGRVVTAGLCEAREADNREYNIAAMVILALETVTRAGSLALSGSAAACHAMIGDPARAHGVGCPAKLLAFARGARSGARGRRLFCRSSPAPDRSRDCASDSRRCRAWRCRQANRRLPSRHWRRMASGWLRRRSPAPARIVVACLDGRASEVFCAAFESQRRRRSHEDAARSSGARGHAGRGRRRTGRAAGRICRSSITGDGAVRYRDVFARATCRSAASTRAALNLAARRPSRLRRGTSERPWPRTPCDRSTSAGPMPSLHATRERPPAVRAHALDGRSHRAAPRVRPTSRPSRDAAGTGVSRTAGAPRRSGGSSRTRTSRGCTCARTAAGDLVAYCACWMVFDELHINSLAVDERVRRQGIARRLLDRSMRDAVAAGARVATLEVRQSNAAARALYGAWALNRGRPARLLSGSARRRPDSVAPHAYGRPGRRTLSPAYCRGRKLVVGSRSWQPGCRAGATRSRQGEARWLADSQEQEAEHGRLAAPAGRRQEEPRRSEARRNYSNWSRSITNSTNGFAT